MIAQNEPNGVHSLFVLSLTLLKGKLIWIEIYQDIPLITNIYIGPKLGPPTLLEPFRPPFRPQKSAILGAFSVLAVGQ